MSAATRLALAGLFRAPARASVRVAVLAAAVALLGSMILFIGHSLGTMTASAVRSVPLDWQGPVDSYPAAIRATAAVAAREGVLAAVPAATAPFAAAERRAQAGEIRTSSGSIVAVPSGTPHAIRMLRFLHGSLRADGIVLDQQLAATLQARVGDVVQLRPRRGLPSEQFRVSGVAVLAAPDVLFQPLNPLLGPSPAQPPANVAIVPLKAFARRIAPKLSTIASGAAAAGVPGAQSGVQWQILAQVDPRALGGSPGHALRRANQIRNAVESTLPGQVRFVDNLSEALTTATGDALYAEALYIMLAVPGALVALGLAYLAALGTVERDRRSLSLLRARGASRRDLLVAAAVESLLLGLVAGVLGAAAAAGAVALLVGGSSLGAARLGATAGICVALAVLGAGAARFGAGVRAARASVAEGRGTAHRPTTPLWERLHLDLLALLVSGLVYYLTARTGFSAVVNPDSNPTLSLSVYMFLAPALLWIGATLLLVRIRGRLLAWVADRRTGGRATRRSGFLLASAGRRSAAINRALVLVGLLLAFGVNLGVFTATYDQQARVDARLTLGADVVITAPPGVTAKRRLEAIVRTVPGVTGTTALDHSYAYVGPDLQDTFGIDPATFTAATDLRDSYFLGGTAAENLARLRATRDGVLVSKETITDYSLRTGDLLRLRVLDRRSGAFHVVPFHVVGVVQEFPSAPRDSFMVANDDYLLAVTHDPGPNVVFAKTGVDPAHVARRIAEATRGASTTVTDIRRQTAQTVSSITAVDLRGIGRIEEAFSVALAAAAMGLFVALAVAERRREFAIAAAVGASLREIAAFVWSEVAIVLGAAFCLAALLGWLLSEMLVAMLRHAFDPPPDHLAAPWAFLASLGVAAIAGAAIAASLAARRVARLPLGAILREE